MSGRGEDSSGAGDSRTCLQAHGHALGAPHLETFRARSAHIPATAATGTRADATSHDPSGTAGVAAGGGAADAPGDPKLPERRLSVVVLANTEALWWGNSVVCAEIATRPVAMRFLADCAAPVAVSP